MSYDIDKEIMKLQWERTEAENKIGEWEHKLELIESELSKLIAERQADKIQYWIKERLTK